MLFSLALRDYNVAVHHPHPPGFPLFIAAGKVLSLFGLSDFRALQAVTLIGGILLFPAMFVLARELRFSPATSGAAALVLAFLPNVWFFSETAFSDVPSLTLVVAACALLLRGCRNERAYIAGALVLAVSIGFRPQNLAIGLVPGLMATWCQIQARRFNLIGGAALAAVVVIVAAYGGAIYATGGWGSYRHAVAVHERYIRTTDSFTSPTRPALFRVSDDFFVRPFRAGIINNVMVILAALSMLVSIVRVRWPVLLAMATFGPFVILAWLLLDYLSASRFSIAYMPMVALLSVDGIEILSTATRWPRAMFATFTAALVTALVLWTLPVVRIPARELSPPMQAITWIREHVDPRTATIYVAAMTPHATYGLPDYRVVPLNVRERVRVPPNAWFLKEGSSIAGSHTFRWPRGKLWSVARHRYFEVSVTPLR